MLLVLSRSPEWKEGERWLWPVSWHVPVCRGCLTPCCPCCSTPGVTFATQHHRDRVLVQEQSTQRSVCWRLWTLAGVSSGRSQYSAVHWHWHWFTMNTNKYKVFIGITNIMCGLYAWLDTCYTRKVPWKLIYHLSTWILRRKTTEYVITIWVVICKQWDSTWKYYKMYNAHKIKCQSPHLCDKSEGAPPSRLPSRCGLNKLYHL